MGVSKEQTALNRQAIVAAAAKLFRERGVDGVGIVELMKEAGFTQGGFYNHFESKQALAAEVVGAALDAGKEQLGDDLTRSVAAKQDPLARQLDYYFSTGHRDDIEHGCPVGGLARDVANLNEMAQQRFAAGLNEAFGAFEAMLPPKAPGSPLEDRERAIGLYCEMVGALLIARSISATEPALSEEILRAAHRDTQAKL